MSHVLFNKRGSKYALGNPAREQKQIPGQILVRKL